MVEEYQPGQLTGMISIAGSKAPPQASIQPKKSPKNNETMSSSSSSSEDGEEVQPRASKKQKRDTEDSEDDEDDGEDSEDSQLREMQQNKYMRRTYLEGGSSDDDEDEDSDDEDIGEGDEEKNGEEGHESEGDEEEDEEMKEDKREAELGKQAISKYLGNTNKMVGGGDFNELYEGEETSEEIDQNGEEASRAEDEEDSDEENETSLNNATKDIEKTNENIIDAFERGEQAQLEGRLEYPANTESLPETGAYGNLQEEEQQEQLDEPTKTEASKNEKLRRALATQEATKRTVFIGNVDVSVKIKELAHWIKQHIHEILGHDGLDAEKFKLEALNKRKEELAVNEDKSPENIELKKLQGGGGFVESIRFRSVPLQSVPVETGSDFKKMRKAAFIRGNFDRSKSENTQNSENEEGIPKYAESMNAFVVLTSQRFVDPLLRSNGKVLKEKHVRIDRAAMPASIRRNAKVSGGAKPEEGKHRRSVFLGNLSFDVSDEEVWQLFSKKIAGGDQAIEQVRVVRDGKTNLGKGIGYVVFQDRSFVSEALGLEGVQLRGREVRVRRCADTNKGKVTSLGSGSKPTTQSKKNGAGPAKTPRKEPPKSGETAKKPRHNKVRPGRNGATQPTVSKPSWMGATPGRDDDGSLKKKSKSEAAKQKQEQKQRKARKAERQAKKKSWKRKEEHQIESSKTIEMSRIFLSLC
eukprot:gb/GECG01011977.1/.p1 GENE.gb/GECG01011977.1/~~gb/GECG01011977.1/.p1  ORF type:complete len:696 (+),score=170.44 gb/GECG01011977.1/:1-2088(+)